MSSELPYTRPAVGHLTTYQARLRRPLLAHDFAARLPDRVIPGGAVVDVTENTDHNGALAVTATVTMDGVLYARDLQTDRSQIIPL